MQTECSAGTKIFRDVRLTMNKRSHILDFDHLPLQLKINAIFSFLFYQKYLCVTKFYSHLIIFQSCYQRKLSLNFFFVRTDYAPFKTFLSMISVRLLPH